MLEKLRSLFGLSDDDQHLTEVDYQIDQDREYNRFSDLLPWTGYWEDEKLFAVEGEALGSVVAIGYAVEMYPQTGANEDMAKLMQEIFMGLPTGSGVQFHLYGSPDISDFLDRYERVANLNALQSNEQRELIKRLTASRIKHYQQASEESKIASRPSVMRNIRVLLSVTIPVKGNPNAMVAKVCNLRDGHVSKLKTYYQFSHVWAATDLIKWVRTLLNPKSHPKDPADYDNGRMLRHQMIYHDSKYDVSKNGIRALSANDDAVVIKTYSILNYPSEFILPQVLNMIGDADQGAKGYTCPFLITLGAEIIDFEAHKNKTQLKAARAIQVSESPLGRMLPDSNKIAQDWRLMQQSYENGNGALRMYHQIVIFSKMHDVARADEAVRSVWRSMGFTLSLDTYMQVQSVMSSLPMSLSPLMINDLSKAQRLTTKTVENAANMVPILGEWTGAGAPIISLKTRNGQVMGLDIFANLSGNYNGYVVGTSGSGKSAFLNELATRYIAHGAKVWIIDVGRSYEKLCEALGGQYIEFTKDANIVLNPFTMITDINEDMEMIKPLLAQMISPEEPLPHYEKSVVELYVKELWGKLGQEMTLDMLCELLARHVDAHNPTDSRIRDLSVKLEAYTSSGKYGQYFTGRHTVNFNSNMVVLELEELKSKKDLQSVVLFILMYRITQDMYLSSKEQSKIVIMDEAWDLLTGGQSGDFIEAGYRRARKYNGAFYAGTQGINDFDRSPAARAARENADVCFMLRQKSESIALLKEKLAFTDDMVRLVSSLRTERGQYSEVFVSCGQMGYGVGILSMDRFSQLMGSANAQDFEAVKAKRALGLSMADAIDAVLRDRGVYEH